jgi:hypothetical protein
LVKKYNKTIKGISKANHFTIISDTFYIKSECFRIIMNFTSRKMKHKASVYYNSVIKYGKGVQIIKNKNKIYDCKKTIVCNSKLLIIKEDDYKVLLEYNNIVPTKAKDQILFDGKIYPDLMIDKEVLQKQIMSLVYTI